jgi:uncharacterized protein (DUF433 family)
MGGSVEESSMTTAQSITMVDMNWREVITADPDVVHGQVRFGGTRIPVSVVLDCLASGMSEAEILNGYLTLPARAVRAALAFPNPP